VTRPDRVVASVSQERLSQIFFACHKLVAAEKGNVREPAKNIGGKSATAGNKKPLKRFVYRGLGGLFGSPT